jgi:transcriptional regulator with XRE-family HTH domain
MGSTIGSKLKDLRKEKGWTIEDLAKKLDVSVGIISEWERGIKEPRSSTRKKLCATYNITESSLFETDYAEVDVRACADRIDDSEPPAKFSCLMPDYIEPHPGKITFNNCMEAIIEDDSMAPVARRGQTVIYSMAGTPTKDNDLVYVTLKNGQHLFRYSRTVDKDMIMLTAANPTCDKPAMMVKADEIAQCYKVIGVRY